MSFDYTSVHMSQIVYRSKETNTKYTLYNSHISVDILSFLSPSRGGGAVD